MRSISSISITLGALLGSPLHGYNQGTYLLIEFADSGQASAQTDRIVVDDSLIADDADKTETALPSPAPLPLFQIEASPPSAFSTGSSNFSGSLTPFVEEPAELFTLPVTTPPAQPIDDN